MSALLDALRGGDLRSIGKANQVARQVINHQELVPELFDGLQNEDPIIRMRAADALEKVSVSNPECFQPFKERFIREVSRIDQQEVRWHFAQICPRLNLSLSERRDVTKILFSWINGPEKSKIVKTFAMQALVDFSKLDESLHLRVLKMVREAIQAGSPAMKARGKKLLKELQK